MAIETQYGFAPSQFRLWLALHEVTHRLQFTAVPWLRDHFVGLVSSSSAAALGRARTGFADVVRHGDNRDPGGEEPVA